MTLMDEPDDQELEARLYLHGYSSRSYPDAAAILDPSLILSYYGVLVKVSKRAIRKLNEDILKIYYSIDNTLISIKEDYAYPACTHQRTIKKDKDQYAVSKET
ncbi:hypothetical protein Tco_0670006 [Tanacetum coccineum]